MELTYSQFYLYVFIGQLILGVLFGLIPLILGKRRGKKRLGLNGFIATVAASALSPLIGLIVLGVFIWLIVSKPSDPNAAG
jgi:hypothetical protein